ncbi:putative uncharacterized protein [Waddlia chondrophila 2032/99]|uniref:Uncharacterized protein n=1 Tax=Waddlia chondrophila 2032/99 TaxID=765953 RepID=F8LFD7_9BACT|nr:putative uncharacterized protein [Waddlia chondrophila 2032/99]
MNPYQYLNKTYLTSTFFSICESISSISCSSYEEPLQKDDSQQLPSFSSSDILLNFFKNRPLPSTSLPPFTSPSAVIDLFNSVEKENQPLLLVLRSLFKEINQFKLPQTSMIFQGPLLLHLLNQAGYLHDLFNRQGLPLPLEQKDLLDDPELSLLFAECLITVQNTTQLIQLAHFLNVQFHIESTISNNTLTAEFKKEDGTCVILKITTEKHPLQNAIALDLQDYFANQSDSMPLLVQDSNPWNGLVLELTRCMQPKNWIDCILQYSYGKRAPDQQEINAIKQDYVGRLPCDNRGAQCAQDLIQVCYASQISNGDAFFTIALQLLVSTDLNESEKNTCLKELIFHLETLSPITDPTLASLLKSCRNKIPFSIIQSFMEIAAIQGTLRHSDRYRTTLTRSGEELHIRLSFGKTGTFIFLPFNPKRALMNLTDRQLTSNCYTLFLELTESLGKPRIKDLQTDFILSNSALAETLDSLARTENPLLCHLALHWAYFQGEELPFNRNHLVKILIAGFSSPMNRKASLQLLEALSSSQISLPSDLTKTFESLLKSTKYPSIKIIRNCVKTAFLNDKTVGFLTYDLWKEEVYEAETLSNSQFDEGKKLLQSLLSSCQWRQTIEILGILSKKTPQWTNDVIEIYIQIFNLLPAVTSAAEKDDSMTRLARQLENTLKKHKEAVKTPSSLSVPLREMIKHCIGIGENKIACNFLMYAIEWNLFDDHFASMTEKVLRILYKKGGIDHFILAAKILKSSMAYLSSHDLKTCGKLIASWISKMEFNSDSTPLFIEAIEKEGLLSSFHSSVSQKQKSEFYETIYKALAESADPPKLLKAMIAWMAHSAEHSIDLHSPKGYLEKLEQLLLQLKRCTCYNTLESTLLLLKKLPNEKKLTDSEQKKRAELHFQLLTRAYLIAPDTLSPKAHLSYFISQTAVFEGYGELVQLLKKAQK